MRLLHRRSGEPPRFRTALGVNIALLLTVAVFAAAGIGVLLWVALGRPSLPAGPWTTADSFDFAKVVLAIVGGIGAVVALVVAYRKQHLGEAAEFREDAKLFAERFTKAADQLGSDKAPVRLAGMYALEGLAQGAPEQRQMIVNVLCAYLRMPYLPPAVDDVAPEENARREQERQVRLTTQRVLAAHLRPGAEKRPAKTFWADIDLDLTGATLVDLDFSGCHMHTARFSGARFAGDSNFDQARFTAAVFPGGAWFKEARFDGDTSFNETWFAGIAGFNGVQFGGDVKFYGAQFDVEARFFQTRFDEEAAFGRAVFNGHASFEEAQFRGKAEFDYAQFNAHNGFDLAQFGADATFLMARFNGTARFSGAWFTGNAQFSHAQIDGHAMFNESLFSASALFERTQISEFPSFDNARVRLDVPVYTERRWPAGWSVEEEDQGPDVEGRWGILTRVASR
jgi:uncharacterized protein YjbI with pentapeptide repeats